MRVRTAVLSSLALLQLLAASSCSGMLGCDPPKEAFDLDHPVTAAEIDALIEAGYPEQRSWETVQCETVCRRTYSATRRWQWADVASCTLVLPAARDGSGTEGRITCAGTGVQYLCEGRRPLVHAEAGDEGCADAVGRGLAAMAYLEAASVLAFEELAAWLSARRAPCTLVDRCRAAAEDERHHTRWLTRLAAERGATVPVPTEPPASQASVFAVAMHNAVEGCVHESFAALMAAVRAERACDPRLRAVFARLAADETRHGQLAWDLHAWLCEQLEPAQAQRVNERRRHALAELPARARALRAELPAALGLLDASEAEALASSFARLLAA